jgi:hypothetical protein
VTRPNPDALLRHAAFEGLDPEQGNDILASLCHHFRLRPEEFFERDG